jgi:hypothetical protein
VSVLAALILHSSCDKSMKAFVTIDRNHAISLSPQTARTVGSCLRDGICPILIMNNLLRGPVENAFAPGFFEVGNARLHTPLGLPV